MKSYFLFILITVSGNCLAGGTISGKVVELHAAINTPAVLFRVGGEIDNTPNCNESGMLAIDLSKVGGNAMLELVKMAKEFLYTIEVTGLGTCGAYWKAEDVKEISIR